MFRALVKKRKDLTGNYVADIRIISGDIEEDKQQKASSSIIVEDLDKDVEVGDVLGIYDDYGSFYYWGIIEAITDLNDNLDVALLAKLQEISLSQFESLYNDDFMLVAQTSGNAKSFFNTKTVSDIIDFYLSAREFGFTSIKNSMANGLTPVLNDFIDADVKTRFKGLNHTVIDNDTETHMVYPIEKEVINLTDFLYQTFSTYQRVIRPYISKVSLPEPYVEVEYIEATGTQYINTGIIPGSTENLNKLRIEIDGQFTELTSDNQYICGSGYYNSTAGARRNIIISANETNFNMLNGAQISNARAMGSSDLERHHFTIDQIRRAYILRNYNYYGQTPQISNVLVKPFLLFAAYNSDTSGASIFGHAKARIYGAKIFREDELIGWYIPCYNRDTSEVGLYDKISNIFLTNQGTGEFIRSQKLTDNALKLAIFNPDGVVAYDGENTWDYSKKTLFNTWEYIKNVEVTKEDVEFNTLFIYSDDGTSLRGAYTLLENGDIQQLTADTPQPNRIGAGISEYIFDGTNNVDNIIRSALPEVRYNHKITFDIVFNDTYGFKDFNIGQRIAFYKDNELYDSVLTGRSYSITNSSDTIVSAKFTLGKVRTNLTSKININKIQTKKK